VVKELKERLGDQQAAFDADIKVFQQTVLDECGRSASSDDVAKFTKDKPALMAKIFHIDKDAQFVIGLLNGIVAGITSVVYGVPALCTCLRRVPACAMCLLVLHAYSVPRICLFICCWFGRYYHMFWWDSLR